MSVRIDIDDGLPEGFPQDPKASPGGTPERGDADSCCTPGEKAILDKLIEMRAEYRKEMEELREENKELKEELKDTKEELKDTKEELKDTKEELKDTKEELKEVRRILMKHDEYTRGEKSSNEEKIHRTTLVFMRWLDIQQNKEEWEQGVVMCVKEIANDRIVIRARKLSQFLRLIFRCMRMSQRSAGMRQLQEHIRKHCMRIDGTRVVPIGDIHSMIKRVS